MSKEWTRVTMQGASPAGRYGHAVTMVGTKFFIFGGQVDGEFLNDLWSFDLNTCKHSSSIVVLSRVSLAYISFVGVSTAFGNDSCPS